MNLSKPDLIIANFMQPDTSNTSIWIVTCILVLLVFVLRHHLAAYIHLITLLNSRVITKSNIKKLATNPLIKKILQRHPLLTNELQPLLFQPNEIVSTADAKTLFKTLLIRSLTTV